MDFWGFLEHVPEGLTGAYLSTIGYSNIFSGFCALLAVSAMAGFCLGGEREVLAVCFIGFLGLFAGNSDGGFLGVFAGFLFLPAAFYKSKIYLYRITQTGAAFSAACFAAWLLGKKGSLQLYGTARIPGILADSGSGTGVICLSVRGSEMGPERGLVETGGSRSAPLLYALPGRGGGDRDTCFRAGERRGAAGTGFSSGHGLLGQ